MRKELQGPKVENVAVAVVQHIDKKKTKTYNVYLLNLSEEILEGIIITSKGYGENPKTAEKIETTVLRHTIEAS